MPKAPDLIRIERKRRNLTQKQLAERLGYKSASVIQRAEAGKLSYEQLKPIIKALGLYEKSFTVYTDGGCIVNPGGKGGYGVVIINNTTNKITELSEGYASTTNNRMEIMAAIAACEALPDGATAVIYSDSQYVVKTMNGQFSKNKNTDLWSRLEKATHHKKIKFIWVRGHDGNKYNERCDALATAAYSSGNLKNDLGYTGVIKTEQTGAMSVEINVEDTPEPEITDIPGYAEICGISEDCAKSIQDFYSADSRSFKAYAGLKTYGTDWWSDMYLRDLTGLLGVPTYEEIKKYCDNTKSQLSALRWFGRGLTLKDAIRRALVEQEIFKNK